MTRTDAPRDRPSLREAAAGALVAAAFGAMVAWTAAPVSATRAPSGAAAPDPFHAVSTRGPAWFVSPRAARPGEVVHVRIRYVPTIDPATGQSSPPPLVAFAFLNDLRHPVQGQVYKAEGTFGVDLVVPPGTDWGEDPIVWAAAQTSLVAISIDRFSLLTSRNALIPFVATRSAQPPLWNR
jgi:hypothetical protein